MNVKEIVAEYLKENGFGGLSDGGDCGCFDDDLIPCGESCDQCEAVYKVPAHCDTCEAGCDGRGESDFCLTTEQPAQNNAEAVANGSQQTLPAAPGVPGLAQGHIGNVG